jgi:hypothetical protein
MSNDKTSPPADAGTFTPSTGARQSFPGFSPAPSPTRLSIVAEEFENNIAHGIGTDPEPVRMSLTTAQQAAEAAYRGQVGRLGRIEVDAYDPNPTVEERARDARTTAEYHGNVGLSGEGARMSLPEPLPSDAWYQPGGAAMSLERTAAVLQEFHATAGVRMSAPGSVVEGDAAKVWRHYASGATNKPPANNSSPYEGETGPEETARILREFHMNVGLTSEPFAKDNRHDASNDPQRKKRKSPRRGRR